MKVLDLFCGVGGASYGFMKAGFGLAAGVDIDQTCKDVYETNVGAPFVSRDISDVKNAELRGLLGNSDARVIIGCAPCQPFSNYTQRREDSRWLLLHALGNQVCRAKPELVFVENVPSLTRHADGQTFLKFVKELEQAGYSVTHEVLNLSQYGLPQNRSRLILLASKLGKIEKLSTSLRLQEVCVGDAIGHLPSLKAGERSSQDRLHACAGLTGKNLDRIKFSRQGGTWRDWPEELRANCHSKSSGRAYSSIYGRMSWDRPAPTITTKFTNYGSGRFGHPHQDRAISLREGAVLQSFPEDFDFLVGRERLSITSTARHIGNAVPPLVAEFVANHMREHLNEHA